MDAMEEMRQRIRWLAEHHEREWRTAAQARDRWGAELDALIAEVNVLQTRIQSLEARVSNEDVERATTTAADTLKTGLEQFLREVTRNVRRLLNADRKMILKDMDELRGIVQAVATELGEIRREFAQHRQEVKEGLTGLSMQLSQYIALTEKHERELGGHGDAHVE